MKVGDFYITAHKDMRDAVFISRQIAFKVLLHTYQMIALLNRLGVDPQSIEQP